MNAEFIVTTFVVFDKTMQALGHQDDVRAKASDAEVLTVAVVAAQYFQNHLERALQVMQLGHYLSGPLSVSRFNRRLHRLAAWLRLLLEALGEVFTQGEIFLIDSMPVPVCQRARAWRCRKVRGKDFCGYCPAKQAAFFGWRLHLICTPAGVPVRFDLVPGGLHDLTPIHAAADEATILADTGVRLIPIRKANMAPNLWADKLALREYRNRIETLYSQFEAMGVARLRARTNPGLELKVHASLLAATIANAD